MKQIAYLITKRSNLINAIILFILLSFAFSAQQTKGQDTKEINKDLSKNDEMLLDQYIKAKETNYIAFDKNNIKQYWIDNLVVSTNDSINIYTSKSNEMFISNLLKIQLANVLETQNCEIEVFADSNDYAFCIFDKNENELSSSTYKENYLQYRVSSCVIHLEDTSDFSFYMQFSSKTDKPISIKKIIFSFSKNKESRFLGSPGFNNLLSIFEKEGKNVISENEIYRTIKYIEMKEYNKMFIMIPENLLRIKPFFYHTYPLDNKDLLSDRLKYGFNNLDNEINSCLAKNTIPKPPSCNSSFIIIQNSLPKYQCKSILIGQFDVNKRLWVLEIKNNTP